MGQRTVQAGVDPVARLCPLLAERMLLGSQPGPSR